MMDKSVWVDGLQLSFLIRREAKHF